VPRSAQAETVKTDTLPVDRTVRLTLACTLHAALILDFSPSRVDSAGDLAFCPGLRSGNDRRSAKI
jgi:hypothetical protein